MFFLPAEGPVTGKGQGNCEHRNDPYLTGQLLTLPLPSSLSTVFSESMEGPEVFVELCDVPLGADEYGVVEGGSALLVSH
jgi:hypothetical protein